MVQACICMHWRPCALYLVQDTLALFAPTYSPPDRRGHEEKRHHHHQRRAVGPGSAVWWFNELMACQVWICLKEMGERFRCLASNFSLSGVGGDILPPGHHMRKQICSRERPAPEPCSIPPMFKAPFAHQPGRQLCEQICSQERTGFETHLTPSPPQSSFEP